MIVENVCSRVAHVESSYRCCGRVGGEGCEEVASKVNMRMRFWAEAASRLK